MRVLALVPPIERHVGHWACSSPSIDVCRVLTGGDDAGGAVRDAARAFRPQVVALAGRETAAYHALLDGLAATVPELRDVPRAYRCQNTALAGRLGGAVPARARLAELSRWFADACDPRFDLVLVQTLTDVDLIRAALAPTLVAACPYGYDPAVFDPDLPPLERTVDVGCYFTPKDNARRGELVRAAEEICRRRGWTFRFETGKYWHAYADMVRTTKVCLHRSEHGEVPFRIYETTCLGAVFVTDPLGYGIERLYRGGEEYLTYRPDLADLEEVLAGVLLNPARWMALSQAGRARAREYTWPRVAERYVAPALRELLGRPVHGTL